MSTAAHLAPHGGETCSSDASRRGAADSRPPPGDCARRTGAGDAATASLQRWAGEPQRARRGVEPAATAAARALPEPLPGAGLADRAGRAFASDCETALVAAPAGGRTRGGVALPRTGNGLACLGTNATAVGRGWPGVPALVPGETPHEACRLNAASDCGFAQVVGMPKAGLARPDAAGVPAQKWKPPGITEAGGV